MKNLLILLGLGAIVYYVSQAQQFIKDIQFAFSDISTDFNATLKSGFSKLFMSIKISVKNDTAFAVKILNIYSDVYYNDTKIGTISEPQAWQVAANSLTSEKVSLTLDTSGAIGIITDLINGGGAIPLTFKGYIDITPGRYNFTYSVTLNA